MSQGIGRPHITVDPLRVGAQRRTEGDLSRVLYRIVANHPELFTERQAEAAALVYGEGMSQYEAADALGITRGSLQGRLRGARARLRRAAAVMETLRETDVA